MPVNAGLSDSDSSKDLAAESHLKSKAEIKPFNRSRLLSPSMPALRGALDSLPILPHTCLLFVLSARLLHGEVD